MLLISKISTEHFLSYKEDYIECLKQNTNNKNISQIIIFVDITHKDLFYSPKIKYILKKDIKDVDLIEIAKKLSSEDRIIWTGYSSITFNNNLEKIKLEKNIYKLPELLIFNKDTKFNSDFQIDEDYKRKIEFPVVHNISTNLKKNPPLYIDKSKQLIKKAELVKIQNNDFSQNLDVIIISVNYNDLLLVSLSHNINIFDKITVVTSSDDLMCQKICEKFEINCLVTDVMYENGSIFNKGKAINAGINSLKNPGFILLIDADIIVSEKIDTDILSTDTLYTSDRWICNTYEEYLQIKTQNLENFCRFEVDKGLGFFQLFHFSKESKFPESSDNASFSDLLFRDKFTIRSKIDNQIIHLGKTFRNWNGRVTERFINDEIFFNLFQNVELLSNKNKVLKKSLRNSNIKPKLAVITTYFNPMNYVNIKWNYMQFSENINCDLFTIELSFDDNFFLEGENVIKISGNQNNILWQKERLLNILIEKIPEEYTNIAWVDCDIIFNNKNWIEETNNALEYYKVTQLYEFANRLDENYQVEIKSKGIIKRIDEINSIDLNLSLGIPGFAWAIRREVLEEIKFLDTQIIGGGDSLMCYSFLGQKRGFVSNKMNPEWFNEFSEWADKTIKIVDKSVTYIKGDITHLYHGKMTNRKYNDRYLILSENNFNPKEDLIKTNSGLWEFKNKYLSDKLTSYFDKRNEDDNIIEISQYFDKIFVLNLDRRPDRWKKISEKLDQFKIKYERFSAIDGEKIDFNNSNFKQGMGLLENKYANACLLSHLEIIKLAKEKCYKRILIFEDDVLLSKEFEVRLQYIRYIKNWKLLYLGCSQYDWNVEMTIGDKFYFSKKSLGTFAYAIDQTIYDDVINILSNEEKSVDNLLSEIQKKYYGDCYTFYPNICKADVSESEIRESRNNLNHSKKMRWNLINYI